MEKKTMDTKPTRNRDKFLQQLGARIRSLREKAGYKNAENFAHDAKISRVMFGYYELGLRNMGVKNLKKIADALGITLEEFFSEGFD